VRPLLVVLAFFAVLIPVLARGTSTHGTAHAAASRPPTPAEAAAAEAAASAKADLEARLAALMKQAPQRSGAWVFDSTGGEAVFDRAPGKQLIPASNMKILTTATALARFGAGAKLRVKVTRSRRGGGRRRRAVTVEVRRLIRWINVPSDNALAEGLLKALGARFRGRRTARAGIRVVRDYMTSIEIDDFVQADGSGLSRRSRISAVKLGQLLEAMLSSPDAADFEASLPLAGHEGTLRRRMRGTAAAGRCRAKTGTLHDVSSLSGYCFGGGRTMVFSILMNGVRSLTAAQKIQDRMVAAIAAY
jgi:D-alanyl-D-alanine carboxypeptidase